MILITQGRKAVRTLNKAIKWLDHAQGELYNLGAQTPLSTAHTTEDINNAIDEIRDAIFIIQEHE